MTKLSMESVTKKFEQNGITTDIFNQVSIDFIQGVSYAIMGKSGSGKSTALHLLAGIDQPTSGIITYNDITINSYTNKQLSHYLQNNISLVFQQQSLFAELTILENVMIKGLVNTKPSDQDRQHAIQILTQMGMQDKLNAFPAMLSGGQQQRVAIARAIYIVPQFLLLDEPTGNLDDATGETLIDILCSYQQQYGMGLIISTHNEKIAQRMQNQLQVIDQKIILL